ncbi:uncharacterized protein LOC126268000 isoform X2 [Schistocerca gregaria]|uniref:uncharacterized protein LOC126268000 isoform X2 n=1 Tax=Schistocerca gregaria TaxID=7010 RepID=UPI00211E85B4|nr:uncharacterized protein LOC126268000 isoform X2 [Schistocerca gregaria]
MAILQSCCCWRSVRMGSYASAAYTTAYFSVMVVIMGRVLHEERQYLQGYVPAPQTTSVLEAGPISPATMCLTVAVLACASCGVIASLLLFYGLYTDRRLLLVPWILVVAANLLLDLAHVVTTIAIGALTFNPLTAFLFTIDFFLITLNVYALLCVVSQFQEYKAGRGTAADDHCIRHVARFATASSRLSVTRPATARHDAKASPTATDLDGRRASREGAADAAGATTTATTAAAAVSGGRLAPPSCRGRVHFQAQPAASASASGPASNNSDEVPSGDVDSSAVVVLLEDQWSVSSKAPPTGPNVETAPLLHRSPQRL